MSAPIDSRGEYRARDDEQRQGRREGKDGGEVDVVARVGWNFALDPARGVSAFQRHSPRFCFRPRRLVWTGLCLYRSR